MVMIKNQLLLNYNVSGTGQRNWDLGRRAYGELLESSIHDNSTILFKNFELQASILTLELHSIQVDTMMRYAMLQLFCL